MARIPYVTDEPTDPAIQEIFAWVTEIEGKVPNDFRLLTHFPEHFKACMQWLRTLWGEGELSFDEIQQIGIAISKANECAFCTGSFCTVLEQGGGVDRDTVEEYLERGAETLGDRDRVLVDFALKANIAPHDVNQADVDGLREAGLSDKGIVQLVWIVNSYAAANRFNTVLGTDLDLDNPYHAKALQMMPSAPGGTR